MTLCMVEQNTSEAQILPASEEESRFLDEVVAAFDGGVKREVRGNTGPSFEKQRIKLSLDKFIATLELPEVQDFLNNG